MTAVEIVEAGESAIREIVKDGYFKFTPLYLMRERAQRIITRAADGIAIPLLRSAVVRSLWAFFDRQWREINTIGDRARLMLVCLLTLSGERQSVWSAGRYITLGRREAWRTVRMNENALGRAMDMNPNAYFRKFVKPTFERLIKQFPKDPDDISGRNSLRNRAEMEVRYAKNLADIEDFRRRGIRLVIASSHIDASARCRPWQGRVYSLDGTRGITPDGREFVPLEEATDIYYTTKAGITYKNGLLGFGCRHFLVPYKNGLIFSAEGTETAYKVTERQRAMEREIRRARTKMLMYKGKSRDLYEKAAKEAKALMERYKAFSREHGRKIVRSRTKIL